MKIVRWMHACKDTEKEVRVSDLRTLGDHYDDIYIVSDVDIDQLKKLIDDCDNVTRYHISTRSDRSRFIHCGVVEFGHMGIALIYESARQSHEYYINVIDTCFLDYDRRVREIV